jgi:hypothetical protein
MISDDMTPDDAIPVSSLRPESGDPLLKRLVDLARLGWEAELVLLTNGAVITGSLISASKFRAALAESIRSRPAEAGASGDFDQIVAAAVSAEDPSSYADQEPDIPEPRFVHLADVRLLGGVGQLAPFMRLRLPAVSGFWVREQKRP